MIEEKSVLAVVPARGGSQGFPGKNLAELGGKPLVAWTIAAAKASNRIDRLILSSDDEAIIEVAKGLGVEAPFRRPAELATDEARVEDALIHVMDALERAYDYIVLLQPTSPLRRAEDIDRCLEICVEAGAPACVSVTEPAKSPYWMFRIDAEGRLSPLIGEGEVLSRRQELAPAFVLNGAVYVAETRWFRANRTFLGAETRAYVMPTARSADVDGEADLGWLRWLVGDGQGGA